MKKERGITLIALVITIIVLLILAAVSIATLTGENGMLTKADTAKTKTTEEQEKEEIKLAYGTAVVEKLSKGDTSNVTADELNAELSKQNTNTTATDGTAEGDIDITFSETNHKYTVHQSEDKKGKITGPTTSQTGGEGGVQGKTAEELYDNVNNPNTDGYKETAMHIGDYVDYDAGEWTETKIAPTASNPFEFGGYTTGQSRNENATGGDAETGKYTGWRIWDIKDGAVILISAGCPELYYHPYGINYAYNSEQILTGSTGGTLATGQLSEPRNWSIYKNGHEYVKEARAMKKSDLDEWYNKYIDGNIDDSYDIDSFPENNTDKLISVVENGMYYWLCYGDGVNDGLYCVSPIIRCVCCNYGDLAGGVRALVTLNSEVKYDKAESVAHDGFTYNKWNIITE